MRLNASKKLSLGAMVTALTVLCLYAVCVLPWSKLACCFLSSIFIYILSGEGAYFYAFVSFAASAALSFFILPQQEILFAYVILFGHYGIFRAWADARIKDRFIRFFSKLLYSNAFCAIGLLVLLRVLSYDLSSMLPAWSLWVLVIALEGAFVAYELLYGVCVRIYNASIRNQLLPRR
ncbi:MAG: hypothetical protein PHC80_04025 [Eubacteriales bacterium]|nr:hypothetical protein [Eubacteriales bacterium]